MIDSADVVVIGAGALGASVTYHLAKAGAGDVVLLDKSQPVSQTSSHAAGLSSQVQPTPFLTRMATQSVRAVERFEQDTGESLAFHQPGSLRLALTDEYARRLRYDVEHARALGVVVDLIEHDATGWLSATEPGPLADALRTLLDDDARRTRLGGNARRFVERNFSIDSVVDAELAVLRDAVSGAQGTGP